MEPARQQPPPQLYPSLNNGFNPPITNHINNGEEALKNSQVPSHSNYPPLPITSRVNSRPMYPPNPILSNPPPQNPYYNNTQNPTNYINPQQNPTIYNNPQQNPTNYNNPQQNPINYINPTQNSTNYNNPQQNPTNYNNSVPNTINYSNPPVPNSTSYNNSLQNQTGYSNPVQNQTGYNNPVQNQTGYNNPVQNSVNYNNQGSYYGQQQQNNNYGQGDVSSLSKSMGGLSVTQQGYNKLWGNETIDLLRQRQILGAGGAKPPEIRFQHEYMNSINCSPDIFRCTLTKIPETKQLLQKSRLPLGILIHPFKDLTQLPVIQCSAIVRCRACRTYINPFVYFIDQRRWKCNLCFRVNDLPEEFQYDPVTRTSGDPSRRPEVRSATIEFIAPADYMVRPPQAAVYLYLFDVSANAVDSGYLKSVCDVFLEEIDNIPGDSRTQIGLITFDSSVHFYSLNPALPLPRQLVVCDIDDIFIPCPSDLLVSLNEGKEMIRGLLTQLPLKFLETSDNQSALGPALLAAQKLLAPIGGRITVFQSCLPSIGPGALTNRESMVKSSKDLSSVLSPCTDFYKKVALECSQQYIAVDCFFVNNQYVDIASIGCVSKFSGGNIYQFPNFNTQSNPQANFLLEQAFARYLTRKIGFEAVMRVRCSRGLSIHTFHGNLFVRSTDLLSLPNCNPDAGFGMQVSIDESLSDLQTVCFQAALLYTSSKGERRIRVHTLCLPVAGNVNDIICSADPQCIIGLVAKMAVDRSSTSPLDDVREGIINSVVDPLSSFATIQNSLSSPSLLAPPNLALLPTYAHSLLRSSCFRTEFKGGRVDERVMGMNNFKTLPLNQLIQSIYPDLYPLHMVEQTPLMKLSVKEEDEDEVSDEVPDFPHLQLCSDRIELGGVYLMDTPTLLLVYVCKSVSLSFCTQVLGVPSHAAFIQELNEFPELENPNSIRIRNFVNYLQSLKPYSVPLLIIRDDSPKRMLFVNNMMEDRGDGSVSLYEFYQQIKPLIR